MGVPITTYEFCGRTVIICQLSSLDSDDEHQPRYGIASLHRTPNRRTILERTDDGRFVFIIMTDRTSNTVSFSSYDAALLFINLFDDDLLDAGHSDSG